MGTYAGCWREWRRRSSLSDEIKNKLILVHQVKGHDYNPPKHERILEWQAKQDFAICPTPGGPGACNVYVE